MRFKYLIVILILFLSCPSIAYAGLFSMSKPLQTSSGSLQEGKPEEEIPVVDTTDKLFSRRQQEAHKLIVDGRELIKKGERKNNHNLVMKGKIKKEIGETQLKAIRDQIKSKKTLDKNDDW